MKKIDPQTLLKRRRARSQRGRVKLLLMPFVGFFCSLSELRS